MGLGGRQLSKGRTASKGVLKEGSHKAVEGDAVDGDESPYSTISLNESGSAARGRGAKSKMQELNAGN